MSDELKPCPFCGSQPKTRTESGDERTGYADTFKIQCSGCGITVQASGDTSKPGYADNSNNQKRATEKWNRRATPPSPSTAPEPQLCDFGNEDDFDEAHDEWERQQRNAEVGAMEYNGNTVSYMYSKARNYGSALVECCNLIGGDGHIRDRIKRLIAERDELKSALSSTAPTVEVDERAAFEAWWHERSLKSWQSGLLASEYGNPMPDGWGDGYKRHALESWMARAALASKPPAREVAERQSIAYDPEFVIILKRVMAASERIDSYHGQRLIAHIDTWGGAAPAAGNTAPLAYIAPHVMESLRAGCHVATVLKPQPEGIATEALYGAASVEQPTGEGS